MRNIFNITYDTKAGCNNTTYFFGDAFSVVDLFRSAHMLHEWHHAKEYTTADTCQFSRLLDNRVDTISGNIKMSLTSIVALINLRVLKT